MRAIPRWSAGYGFRGDIEIYGALFWRYQASIIKQEDHQRGAFCTEAVASTRVFLQGKSMSQKSANNIQPPALLRKKGMGVTTEMHWSRRDGVLLALAVALIFATWLTLVIWQPQDSSWESLADATSSTIALVGFSVPAILALFVVAPKLPVRTLTLMPVALALNIVVGQVVGTMGLPLPLYLDSLGTVLVGALAGPWAGLATGITSALVWTTFNPTIIPFAAAYAFVGFTAGCVGSWWRGPWWRVAVVAAVIGFVTALLSAPVASFIFGGTAGTGTGLLVSFYRSLGFDPLTAVFLQSWTSDPLDKVIVFSAVYGVLRAMPQRTQRAFAMD